MQMKRLLSVKWKRMMPKSDEFALLHGYRGEDWMLHHKITSNMPVIDNYSQYKQPLTNIIGGWMLGINDSPMSKMMTVGVGHSRRYCNTGYDQSQGRRPSTLKCIGSISKGDIEPQPSSQKLIRIRTADREVMVAPGGIAIPGRPVSRT